MSKNTVKFYMKQYPIGGVEQATKDLETDFEGLLVSKVGGLNTKGKNKNIYYESFPEQNGKNVWIGTPYYEATSVTFTFFFVGEDRQDQYDLFCQFVNGYKLYYWDDYYNKRVTLVLEEIGEPTEEKIGNNPNIEATFKFTNINGTYESV